MFRTKSRYWSIYLLLLMLALPFAANAQDSKEKKDKNEKKELTGKPVLWHEPTDLESRNLLIGAGGEEMKPDTSKLTFIEQKTGGYSKKYRVRDAKGNEWIAKIGKEAQTDTAANRLLWALGYETEIAYLVPKATIEGKGEFENVRLEARPASVKRAGNWMWENNPFKDAPEFRGLKILMLMINNWDMKDDNNEILATRGDTTGECQVLASVASQRDTGHPHSGRERGAQGAAAQLERGRVLEAPFDHLRAHLGQTSSRFSTSRSPAA